MVPVEFFDGGEDPPEESMSVGVPEGPCGGVSTRPHTHLSGDEGLGKSTVYPTEVPESPVLTEFHRIKGKISNFFFTSKSVSFINRSQRQSLTSYTYTIFSRVRYCWDRVSGLGHYSPTVTVGVETRYDRQTATAPRD